MSTHIIFDTNFLILPYKNKIDVFAEIPAIIAEKHELLTLTSVLQELGRLGKGCGDDAVAARVALKLVEANKIRIIDSAPPADEGIIQYCKNMDKVVVCTNDRELKRRVKRLGAKTISLKGADRLVML